MAEKSRVRVAGLQAADLVTTSVGLSISSNLINIIPHRHAERLNNTSGMPGGLYPNLVKLITLSITCMFIYLKKKC